MTAYRDRCVICGDAVHGDTPAGLLASMVEHYNGHPQWCPWCGHHKQSHSGGDVVLGNCWAADCTCEGGAL